MSEIIKCKYQLELESLAIIDKELGIKNLFENDADRADKFSYCDEGLFVDFSKTHISQKHIDVYQNLANDIDFDEKRINFRWLRLGKITNGQFEVLVSLKGGEHIISAPDERLRDGDFIQLKEEVGGQ